jgi:prepilin-type N-terminal cleavage/methylation domain-containing protein
MRKNPQKGFTLIEILVAGILLTVVTVAALAIHLYVRQINKEIGYRYTALNMAREVVEFGEAGKFNHAFSIKYYYPPAQECSLAEGCYAGRADEPVLCPPGLDTATVGYKAKEWYFFCIGREDPFDYLGDIKEKGLVPAGAPDSVEIYYKVEQDPAFDNAYKETVEIQWRDRDGGTARKETLSVIPITQVNNQLMLVTSEFWWE